MVNMETVVRERRRFFERPEEPRAMRVTARDIALLENVARLRLATTSQLAALDGGSAQNVSRSLLALWENAYVERPEAQAANPMSTHNSATEAPANNTARKTMGALTPRGDPRQ
jgi:hypothetical protein